MDFGTMLQAVLAGFLFKMALDIIKVVRAQSRAEKASQAEGRDQRPAPLELAAELHHGVVYCFEKETDRFVCQGRTLEELIQVYRTRFPNKKTAVTITQFTKEVKEHLEAQQRKEVVVQCD